MWIDSHCHLTSLKCDDVGFSLFQARERGVEGFVCISTDIANCSEVMAYANTYADVYASVGVHPLDLKGDDDVVAQVDDLKQWTSNQKVVAIGETGLDYHYSADSAKEQRQSFEAHINLAVEEELPLVVHTRKAREDTLAMLKEGVENGVNGVLHCFTEDLEMAMQAVEWGFYVSFSGIVTFKNAGSLREVAAAIPADRILVETDSPYLAPAPYRGKPNVPSYVVEVGEFVAEVRGVDKAAFAKQTVENTKRLFFRMV